MSKRYKATLLADPEKALKAKEADREFRRLRKKPDGTLESREEYEARMDEKEAEELGVTR